MSTKTIQEGQKFTVATECEWIEGEFVRLLLHEREEQALRLSEGLLSCQKGFMRALLP